MTTTGTTDRANEAPPIVRPVARQSLTELVVDSLRTAILSGDYAPGDLLPPERELADHLGVNRTTLRDALAQLERLGLVERRQGVGARVLDLRAHGSLELLAHVVTDPATGGFDPAAAIDLAALTGAIFDLVAPAAAHAATDEDLVTLRACLNDIATAQASGDAVGAGAALSEFLRCTVLASHSVVYSLTGTALLRALAAGPATTPDGTSIVSALAALALSDPVVVDDARRLVDAIAAHDPTGALGAARTAVGRFRLLLAAAPDAAPDPAGPALAPPSVPERQHPTPTNSTPPASSDRKAKT